MLGGATPQSLPDTMVYMCGLNKWEDMQFDQIVLTVNEGNK